MAPRIPTSRRIPQHHSPKRLTMFNPTVHRTRSRQWQHHPDRNSSPSLLNPMEAMAYLSMAHTQACPHTTPLRISASPNSLQDRSLRYSNSRGPSTRNPDSFPTLPWPPKLEFHLPRLDSCFLHSRSHPRTPHVSTNKEPRHSSTPKLLLPLTTDSNRGQMRKRQARAGQVCLLYIQWSPRRDSLTRHL